MYYIKLPFDETANKENHAPLTGYTFDSTETLMSMQTHFTKGD